MPRMKITTENATPRSIDTTETAAAIEVVPGNLPTLGGITPDVGVLAATPEGARQVVAWLNDKHEETEIGRYLIGAVLNKASMSKLHKQLGFATFEEFCLSEVQLPQTSAYRYMAIAASLTEQEFRELGPSRAGIIVRLPEKERRALMTEAKKLSVRALAERVAEITDGPKPEIMVQKAKTGAAISFGLRHLQTEIPLTMLGGGAAVGMLAGLNGQAIHIAIGHKPDGTMMALVNPIGAPEKEVQP